ncbi:MAG: hypothetical protein LBR85_03805 [Oscillospiraceae bacterium]|jgi:hypothetical protein|nr:hypothetical protein [Oscillospiraceae bacterium]
MKNNGGTTKRGKRVMLIALIIAILAAAGGWGMVIKLNMTTTPRLNPGALENLNSNELMAISDSALLQALERRNSTARGSFTGNEISEDALQLLGWAATGKNREGTGFVVPLAMGTTPYVSLYLADAHGVRRFSWESNSFESVLEDDIRDTVNGGQNASAVWIYVIEKANVPNGSMDFAWHTIGAMSEHQYLLADELNIQTRFMGDVKADEVAVLLGLDASKNIPAGVMVMAQK